MRTRLPSLLVVLLGAALAVPAHAQWKWRDEDGRINYSNQPPPLSVPLDRILSEGGQLRKKVAPPTSSADAQSAAAAVSKDGGATDGSGATPTLASAAATAAAADGGSANGAEAKPKTAAERLNEMRRRQAEKEDAERMARDQQQAQAKMTQWCREARGSVQLLESDVRVASVNAAGERTTIDDEQRAARLSELKRDIQAHCGKG